MTEWRNIMQLPEVRRRTTGHPRWAALVLLFMAWGSNGNLLAADALPRIPTPAGFVEGAGLSERIRAMAMAGQPAGVKLIGVYYTADTIAEILNEGSPANAPFCKATLDREYLSVTDAKKGFKSLVANAKKECDRPFDPTDPVIRSIWEQQEKARRQVQPNVTGKAKGMSFLGSILDKTDVYADSGLITLTMANAEGETKLAYACALGWLRFGKQQVSMGVMYPFSGGASIEAANKKLLEWIALVQKQNQ